MIEKIIYVSLETHYLSKSVMWLIIQNFFFSFTLFLSLSLHAAPGKFLPFPIAPIIAHHSDLQQKYIPKLP